MEVNTLRFMASKHLLFKDVRFESFASSLREKEERKKEETFA